MAPIKKSRAYTRTYKSPEAAKRAVERMRREGASIEVSEAAERATGISPTLPQPPAFPSADNAIEEALEAVRGRLEDQVSFTEWKDPTNTEWPDNSTCPWGPRSDRASYDPITQILNIEWNRPGRLGPSTNYYEVTPQEWEQVQHTPSTGKYVNRVLNYKRYDYP